MSLGRGQFDPGRFAELAPSYLFEGLAAESFRMRSVASLPPSAAAVPCHESKALVVIGQRDKKPPALLSSTIAHAAQHAPWTAQLIRRSESSFCFQLSF